ncbi:YbgC/FadM family acyl-CoA thioesterase [Leptobacterium flavescens]|uniref:YbgC/FadM family acyl-CoA thioesterase n=1 Tax=Leptobacterium flavescens TaxID=472055 RepID=A0A6P0UL91_9FLAO|nr:thioesterase family protein [Leptobacterium flavescens]NER13292.1 YbgC/FadM family acyl-CoA thioesterase [Leptobacterium flavescens]
MKKSHEIKVRVRYSETDQMGVVYHGNYAQFLELGRVEWLRDLGISYRWMEENGVMLPVISLNLKFHKSAKYDDLLSIKTTLSKNPSVRIEFDYEIHNQNREIITTGNTVLAFINMQTMKPMKCPDYILEKLNGSDG